MKVLAYRGTQSQDVSTKQIAVNDVIEGYVGIVARKDNGKQHEAVLLMLLNTLTCSLALRFLGADVADLRQFSSHHYVLEEIPFRERSHIPPWERKIIFKNAFVWDMFVPRRVHLKIYSTIKRKGSPEF